ncbi:hypothetical protein BT96DRAFT_886762, partial [Gymnopus androsaceus JB14]
MNREDDTAQAFILYGAAGTGKSAISHTIGKKFKKMNCLGGFFCFNRTFHGERTATRAIHSIAYNLGLNVPGFAEALIEVMDKDPYILSSTSIKENWENLVLKPAEMVNYSNPLVIIIDALDECSSITERGSLITSLTEEAYKFPKNYCFLVTSRLENDIVDILQNCSNALQSEDMAQLKQTEDDIYHFIHHKMGSFIRRHSLNDNHCKALAKMAEGYFQWAFTVCNALHQINKPGANLKKKFSHFMTLGPNSIDLYPLDKLYKSILESIFDASDEDIMNEYRKAVSQVLAASIPLSQVSLASLKLAYGHWHGDQYGKEEEEEDLVIQYLGSLFIGVDRPDIPVWPVHTSIRDFLLDGKRSREFAINLVEGHTILAVGSLKIMMEKLHFNMCNLKSSYVPNANLPSEVVKVITPELSYACCFWHLHLEAIEPNMSLMDLINKFLYGFSLYWMEVLSILNRVNVIFRSMENVQQWMTCSVHGDLEVLVNEIRQFAEVFGKVLVDSTPHLYISGLPFIPKKSKLQNAYCSYFSRVARLCYGHNSWWPQLQVLMQGQAHWVTSVAFSPDGKRIVSGSDDNLVRIWNAETGRLEGDPLEGHTHWVTSVAFSPDGKRIVSGSYDNSVRIWNAETGRPEGDPLEGHTHQVTSVGFSPDCKRIVSGSYDKSVRIWNAETGRLEGDPLEGHTEWVTSVGFSSDGKRIVSGSDDSSVRIWNAETGRLEGDPLEGHTDGVTSVAFSSDGKRIVSGSYDNSVRIWN